jgi:acyl-CoA hydrolase
MSQKTPKQSLATNTFIVMPNDTNTLGNLNGGVLLHHLDIIAAIAGQRHSNAVVVTASVNHVSFPHPIKLADIVTMTAKVSRVFKSSMEVFIDVFVEDNKTGKQTKCNEAIYTFVAIDENNKPTRIPKLAPETEEEKTRFTGALRRKQLSLVLGGKMKASDATELRNLFLL